MARRSAYWVEYKMYFADTVKGIDVVAGSAAEAYDKATYEAIPEKEGTIPYSSWVANVTYQNGKQHYFNNFEGKEY